MVINDKFLVYLCGHDNGHRDHFNGRGVGLGIELHACCVLRLRGADHYYDGVGVPVHVPFPVHVHEVPAKVHAHDVRVRLHGHRL